MRYTLAIALTLAPLFCAQPASAQTGGLSFAEIMPNPDGTDTKTNEYIILKNYSDQSQSLESGKICNISNDCYVLKGEMAAGACLKIYRTDFVFTLHNDQERLNLLDADGNIISQVTTGAAPSGKAWLCSESYCQWDAPRETCDYSDIVDPASLPIPEDEDKENSNDNTDIQETESPSAANTNTNAKTKISGSKTVPKKFQIFSQKDWVKVKKEMDQKNLLSLTADIQGNVLVPLNIIKSNTFYLLASKELVPVDIYASRQADFSHLKSLYEAGSKIQIEGGYLKNSLGSWQLGIGKNTRLEAKHNPKSNSKFGDDRMMDIKGKVVRKSGQYFYVEDQAKTIVSVFIPSVVWTKYLEKENVGSFPQLVNNKIVTRSDVKGKNIELSGIVETSGNTQRIVVIDENDIHLEKEVAEPKPPSEEKTPEKQATKAEPPPEPINQSPESLAQPSPEEKSTFSKILMQKLSWPSLWAIASAKISRWAAGLF